MILASFWGILCVQGEDDVLAAPPMRCPAVQVLESRSSRQIRTLAGIIMSRPQHGARDFGGSGDMTGAWDAPAGAATGILLAQGGARVLVLDRARFPRPKICGEYLSPEVARVLDRLRVLETVEASGAVTLSGMSITAPDGTRLTGTYPHAGRWRGYRDHALALPRTTLDGILADRLRGTSADFREGHRVTDLLVEGDRVAGVAVTDPAGRSRTVRARVVVAADGRNSVVARRLGLVSPHPLQRLALVTYAAGVDHPRDRGIIVVDPPVYSIANPVLPGLVNLSLAIPLSWAGAHRGRLDQLFDQRVRRLGHLAAQFPGLRREAPVRALGPLAYRVARPRHRGVLLVGDAAGFYDPFTGEGVYTALRDAELTAAAVLAAFGGPDGGSDVLSAVHRTREAEHRGKRRVTRLVQLVVSRRTLATSVGRVLARRPVLLDLLMGVIGDFVPPGALLGPAMLRALVRGR
jgi:flavin-dependent dehydrogenase